MTHDELIAKLEAATEGSRELDLKVARYFGWVQERGHWARGAFPYGEEAEESPHYTTSLDAALALARTAKEQFLMLQAALKWHDETWGITNTGPVPAFSLSPAIRAALIALIKMRKI